MSLQPAISDSAARIRATGRAPQLAIVLGSGWDGISSAVDDPLDIPYGELPAFPKLAIAGHAGVLRLGRIGGREVALLRGRKHTYESGDAAAMKGALRTLAAIGCGTVLLTNAAGSLDPAMRPGSLMLIEDHLNIVQRTPLHDEPGNERFVNMADAYDPALRRQAKDAAAAAGITLHQGVYAWVLGPQFETPAEIRMLQRLGAQAVGMSTVAETILCRHAGLKVLGISMLTNMGCGMEAEVLSHAHTLNTADATRDTAAKALQAIIPALSI
ncbi:purine-nucleoside phosphorylase [Aquincola sp. S2]|uniref:Purine nucleoside phosphorylase n=1 Tax=Pseudaquabacterium terrae TaxID=2732868 RepID=A0ABX2EKQ5_9BURK|nr:purine-nucleoside phosphorylase [Aquabacterium terrae]NRF69237.1 purine-nucleoside phosphorylase [Aquabacterium terrae]